MKNTMEAPRRCYKGDKWVEVIMWIIPLGLLGLITWLIIWGLTGHILAS
jgi:hypothetical protein